VREPAYRHYRVFVFEPHDPSAQVTGGDLWLAEITDVAEVLSEPFLTSQPTSAPSPTRPTLSPSAAPGDVRLGSLSSLRPFGPRKRTSAVAVAVVDLGNGVYRGKWRMETQVSRLDPTVTNTPPRLVPPTDMRSCFHCNHFMTIAV
jgi:hypothetical protein